MRRVQGTIGVALVECINRYIGKYRIRWDILSEPDDNINKQAVSFYEIEIISQYKPKINNIKQALLDGINQMIDDKILSGFVWKDMPVWLSTENQFNYKAAYDLAVMSQGKSLPVLFKFGTTENPIYYTFETLEDISDFYLSAMAYISKTLEDGWVMKDSIDWSEYEEALKKL